MIDDPEPLIKKYGAIAAQKNYNKFPELITHAASCGDADVQLFSKYFIELQAKLKEHR